MFRPASLGAGPMDGQSLIKVCIDLVLMEKFLEEQFIQRNHVMVFLPLISQLSDSPVLLKMSDLIAQQPGSARVASSSFQPGMSGRGTVAAPKTRWAN